MATLRQALEYASQNPNNDFAKFLMMRIQSGEADTEARQAGIDLTAIKKLAPSKETKQPGYFSRVGTELSTIGKETYGEIQKGGQEAFEQLQQPQQSAFGGLFKGTTSLLRTGLRTAGAAARSVFTPITEAPVIKPAIEKIGEKITEIPGAEDIIKKLSEWSQKHPEAAKDIENIIDITALTGLPAVTKPIGAITGEATTKIGRILEESGLLAKKAAKEQFAKNLVMPIETKLVKEVQVARTIEKGIGVFKKSEITPTNLEQRAIDEIAKIPEVSPLKTYQQNFNIIRDINRKKAQELITTIEENNFIIPKKEILARLNQAAMNLGDNPIIVGDAEKTAQKLVEGAKKIINENEGTGSGMLKARKEYDIWVQSQKPKIFDAKTENALTFANREIRQTFNDLLEEKAPDLGIKQSLKEQSSLFYAIENIIPKAAKEADTALGRAMDRIGKVLGTKNKAVQAIAAAVGIGGLGAASTFAPAAAVVGGIGFIAYKGGQLILKPEVRIAIGKLLQESGKLLNPEDRKILENALNQYKEEGFPIGMSIQDVSKQIYKGEENLTTKFLEYAKGKTTLSRQEILDFAKRPELKKGEADLLNRLGGEIEETKIPAQEFADSLHRELLPLKPVKVKEPQYEPMTIEFKGRGGYYPGKKYDKSRKNYEEVVFESPITTNGSSHYQNSKNYFAHARGDEVVESGKKIWREQEIQSDLLQKDKLADEFRPIEFTRVNQELGTSEYGLKGLQRPSGQLAEPGEFEKLQPFTNDRFGERIMRERIKEKAAKGYAKYRLPTGETIGKIEGFQENNWFDTSKYWGGNRNPQPLKPTELKVGMEINETTDRMGNEWIITDILGDGRFKAVEKGMWDAKKYIGQNRTAVGYPDTKILTQDRYERAIEASKETFDLTGKSNPQYRRYSDWGKFLKNKFGGKEITDPQGNTWMEIDLKKEYGRIPVEAFGIGVLTTQQEEE